ncbi:MAG: IS200/IS605 family transposase [Polyangiaceae bacterium]|nr:IS200/IS605 family transposase [Polyangiaceae bacterium]
MSKTFTELFVHVVWGTFRRTPWIAESVEKPLYAAMSEKCREIGCVPMALGGTSDHVHMLAALTPTMAVATFVKEIKGASAYIISHGLLPNTGFRWQEGYGAFTLRKTDLPTVRNYVLQQKEHHGVHTIAPAWELPTNDGSTMKPRT